MLTVIRRPRKTPASNQLTAKDQNGTYTMTYDAVNRVATVKEPFTPVLTFTYDAVGNRTKVEDSFGGITSSTYDLANRLTKREFGGTNQTPLRLDLTYTNRDQLATSTRYSDVAGSTKIGESFYTYDSAMRLTNLQHKDGFSANIANYTHTYDNAHRVLTEKLNGGATTTYQYDTTNQLTNDGTTAFTYDANGNRTMSGYATGTGNQLTNDGVYTYTYDNEGNLTKKSKGTNLETWTFGYDHRNQMTWAEKRATDGGTLQMRADYKYDVLGNRIEKAVDPDGARAGRRGGGPKVPWGSWSGEHRPGCWKAVSRSCCYCGRCVRVAAVVAVGNGGGAGAGRGAVAEVRQ